ncbi:MAG: cytochrome c [Chryseolinea sp.]
MKILTLRKFLIYTCITSIVVYTFSCNGTTNPNQTASVKFDQYFVRGQQLYETHCSNCHQKTGTGLGRVYPPLNKSDFVDKSPDKVLCVIKNGIAGELIVNGKVYNQAMKSPGLTDIEIAEIATYIYNSWGREKGIIEVLEVSKVVMKCDSAGIK